MRVKEKPIAVKKDLGEIPALYLDPSQMTEVFVNLIINALDALTEGGELEHLHRSFAGREMGRDQGGRYRTGDRQRRS